MFYRVRGGVHDEESEYSLSDEDYYSHYSTDHEVEEQNSESEMMTYQNKSQTIKVNSKFENVIDFRRALAHYAIMNEFAYFIEKSDPARVTASCVDPECKWRIHASVMQDGISFEVSGLI